MASRVPVSSLITIRDNLVTAVTKLSTGGITSYSIGDQTYSLANIDDYLATIDKLDRQIAARDNTLAGRGNRNRTTFANFNG